MDDFQEELTGAQWREWCAFFDLEPGGNIHTDLLWGLLLALLANKDRGKGPAIAPEDFLPHLAEGRPAPGPLTEEDVIERNLRWRCAALASRGQAIEGPVKP